MKFIKEKSAPSVLMFASRWISVNPKLASGTKKHSQNIYKNTVVSIVLCILSFHPRELDLQLIKRNVTHITKRNSQKGVS